MTNEQNCELLFQYLKSILYDPKVHAIDPGSLDAPYQKLGLGLQYLEKAVQEMKAYSEALSVGKLSAPVPPRDNFLCENLKNIHANLNHLTWQAKQVAKGDYSQHVSYLGEFSEAFNTMTRQLKERELSLKQEAETEKEHARIMDSYNQLLMELIARSEESIMVISMTDQKVLYRKGNDSIRISPDELYSLCMQKLSHTPASVTTSGQEPYRWTWETEDSEQRFYRITTGVMRWKGERAYVHIVREITAEKNREAQLRTEAYRDTLTGIWNRNFFQAKAQELLDAGVAVLFCYCDLDHLKYINDRYGHHVGDRYIRFFADCVRQYIRHEDIFARIGGDEFCIILPACTKETAEEKLKIIQTQFTNDTSLPYPKSFSYGLVEAPASHGPMKAEELIRQADIAMYVQKRKHQQQYLAELELSSRP